MSDERKVSDSPKISRFNVLNYFDTFLIYEEPMLRQVKGSVKVLFF